MTAPQGDLAGIRWQAGPKSIVPLSEAKLVYSRRRLAGQDSSNRAIKEKQSLRLRIRNKLPAKFRYSFHKKTEKH
jgi:hypothetical protein